MLNITSIILTDLWLNIYAGFDNTMISCNIFCGNTFLIVSTLILLVLISSLILRSHISRLTNCGVTAAKNTRIYRCLQFMSCYCVNTNHKDILNLLAMDFVFMLCQRVMTVMTPLCAKWIIDAINQDRRFCWELILLEMVIKYVDNSGFIDIKRQQMFERIEESVFRDLQADIFKHVLKMPYAFHLDGNTEDARSLAHSGVENVRSFLETYLFDFGPSLVDILLTCLCLGNSTTWYMALLGVSTNLLSVKATSIVRARQATRKENEDDGLPFNVVQNSLRNIVTVKYFGTEKVEVARLREQEHRRTHQSSGLHNNVEYMVERSVINTSTCLACMMMAYRISTDETLSAGDYVIFMHSIRNLLMPLQMITALYDSLMESLNGMEKVINLLEQPEEEPQNDTTPKKDMVVGDLEFKNVNFSYTEGRPVLKNVSFTVPRGKMVALVGPSGSGKSTIVKLLFRLYNPNEGSITVNGEEAQTISLEQYRSKMAIVPQDCSLFDDSIGYNIRYGSHDATEEEVEQAVKSAQIQDFIGGLEKGLSSKVGFQGVKVSGGERQRIAIARAILKQADYIFMDEATSSLDSQTERDIQKALTEVCKSRTSIFIAHRLSTIAHADKIIVLRHGEIIEQGTHSELLKSQGLYYKMWQLQCANMDIDTQLD